MRRLLPAAVFAAVLAGVLAGVGAVSAMTVSVESALLCPELADFRAIGAGGSVPPACVRVGRHEDLYGPVGRAAREPGGPFVRVRRGDVLYWAEESAFYPTSGEPAAPGALPPPIN